MSGDAKGGNDTATNDESFYSASITFYGDAGGNMSGHAKGGDDILTGSSHNFLDAPISNTAFGDAQSMSGFAKGGDDTLVGGDCLGPGSVSNILFGDASSLSGFAEGGDDTLFAGTAAPNGMVSNVMWGDGSLLGGAHGGRDLFVFRDDGLLTVGTQNTIEDFSQRQHDRIEFSDVAGVDSFHDLVITHAGADTVITAGADQVTLHNFTGSLTAHDFLFV
jgi:hypothetical protein